MIGVFEYLLTVEPDDIDVQGHVGNERYVAWMSQAATAHSDALGWTHDRYTQAGVAWYVREHHIRYLRPAVPGDSIVVRTWVASIERMTSLRRYEFVHGSTRDVLVRAETQWAFYDLVRRRPCRILPEVALVFPVAGSSFGKDAE